MHLFVVAFIGVFNKGTDQNSDLCNKILHTETCSYNAQNFFKGNILHRVVFSTFYILQGVFVFKPSSKKKKQPFEAGMFSNYCSLQKCVTKCSGHIRVLTCRPTVHILYHTKERQPWFLLTFWLL